MLEDREGPGTMINNYWRPSLFPSEQNRGPVSSSACNPGKQWQHSSHHTMVHHLAPTSHHGHLTWLVVRHPGNIISSQHNRDTETDKTWPKVTQIDTKRERRRKPLHSKFPTLIIGNKLFGWCGEVFFLSELAVSNYPGDISNIFTATSQSANCKDSFN